MALHNIIRFDWAMKRLLRDKANFVVLEGFLSELLQDDIKIHRILESEGNKEDESDKFNRVDVLAENNKKELIIIEVQNTRELYYFQRMLYGVSKAITEYIHEGNLYSEVRKVYSVNIVYFDLGQGNDYIYRGITNFKGLHTGDTLRLSTKQRNTFVRENAGDIFPEYYVLRVNEFNDKAKTPLDEWMRFLKSGIIDEKTTAKGLQAARQRLNVANMSEQERRAYERHMDNIRIQWDVLTTAHEEGRDEGIKEGIKEGIQQEKKETARKLLEKGLSLELIAECTGLPIDEIKKI
ncbi:MULTISPECIES: Rpn family recombination-promoting nuclease/putative transposase [Butyricimonas]|mgnify:FL=1|uniref:Rpn family recombination-promoting nuclease/putative transposase n=1 Tax=Butyricimonas TaxID=574697 RepID=UPI00039CEB3E|nr:MULTISPECIES: Rpn family recombination-promoting nuclease/putative transposase [Butyricimonas]